MTARTAAHMAFLLLAFGVLVGLAPAPAARADTIDETDYSAPDDNSLINAYYHRCLNTVYQDQSPETRDEFCSCTAAYMKGVLRTPELKTMATGAGRPVDPKMLAIKVIAPCLTAPMVELEYNQCMGDTRFTNFFKTQNDYNATCHCISSGIGDYISQFASDLLAYLIEMNPDNANNPADALKMSAQVISERTKLRNKCMGLYSH